MQGCHSKTHREREVMWGFVGTWELVFLVISSVYFWCPCSLLSLSLSLGEPMSETILPSSCVLRAVSWEIETAIWEARRTDPDPGGGPSDRLYVPAAVHSQVLQWGHSSRFACHPELLCTLQLLWRQFWWHRMERDICGFVEACTVCARIKASQPASIRDSFSPCR